MTSTSANFGKICIGLAPPLVALLAGCAIVPGETRIPLNRQVGSRHHSYNTPKTEGQRVKGVAKLNPSWWIQNSDDPLPWWWKPDAPLSQRRRTWMLRNSFHNFTHYVVGVSDRHSHRIGINAQSIWNDDGPFNMSVTRCGPLIYLPMVSNRGPFLEWYVGWRVSGSWGAALRLAQHDSDGTGSRGRSPLAKAMAAKARAMEAVESQEHGAPAPTTILQGVPAIQATDSDLFP